MANGILVNNFKVKAKAFSGTTDAAANLLLTLNEVTIVNVSIDQGYIAIPFVYVEDNGRYIKVKNAGDSPQINKAVSGYYYYIDKGDITIVT